MDTSSVNWALIVVRKLSWFFVLLYLLVSIFKILAFVIVRFGYSEVIGPVLVLISCMLVIVRFTKIIALKLVDTTLDLIWLRNWGWLLVDLIWLRVLPRWLISSSVLWLVSHILISATIFSRRRLLILGVVYGVLELTLLVLLILLLVIWNRNIIKALIHVVHIISWRKPCVLIRLIIIILVVIDIQV